MKKIIKNEGFMGLYKGLSACVLGKHMSLNINKKRNFIKDLSILLYTFLYMRI